MDELIVSQDLSPVRSKNSREEAVLFKFCVSTRHVILNLSLVAFRSRREKAVRHTMQMQE